MSKRVRVWVLIVLEVGAAVALRRWRKAMRSFIHRNQRPATAFIDPRPGRAIKPGGTVDGQGLRILIQQIRSNSCCESPETCGVDPY